MRLSPAMTKAVLALAGENPGTPARKKTPAVLPPLAQHRVKLTVGAWLPAWLPPAERNQGGGLGARLGRKRRDKELVGEALARLLPVSLPVVVTFLRCTTAVMDDDNLRDAYKVARDVIADWLGCDDGDTARVTWVYKQERVRPTGTHITIREV